MSTHPPTTCHFIKAQIHPHMLYLTFNPWIFLAAAAKLASGLYATIQVLLSSALPSTRPTWMQPCMPQT